MTEHVLTEERLFAVPLRDDGGAGAHFGSGDSVIVEADERIVYGSPFFDAVMFWQHYGEDAVEDVEIVVDGGVVIFGEDRDTVFNLRTFVGRLNDTRIEVGEEGNVATDGYAFELAPGSNQALVNSGIVAGSDGAIRAGGGLQIENKGRIVGTWGVIEVIGGANSSSRSDGPPAEEESGGRLVVANEGLIAAEPEDPEFGLDRADYFGAAVSLTEGAVVDLHNEAGGRIDAAAGVAVDSSDPFANGPGGGRDVVRNDGVVVGHIDLGREDDRLENTGRIGGASEIFDVAPVVSDVLMGPGADTVENSGLITGDVDLGGGADSLRVSGTVEGAVRLGRGDDFATVLEGGEIAGGIEGGAGDDTFLLREGAEVGGPLAGGEGSDRYTIFGDVLPQIVEAADDADAVDVLRVERSATAPEGIERLIALKATEGGVELNGNALDNVIRGRNGDDSLRGLDGSDKLRGKRGDDTLVGGRGGDDMKGGRGIDRFVWRDVDEAGTASGERDLVRDFERGVDVLDFTRLGIELTYQPDFFSGTAGEFRLARKDGDTRIRIDTDGDADGNMTIIVRGVADLSPDDLLF